ncbi:MAG: hypothetical protein HXO06_00680 [Prevotella salivae]|uniref:hypothetical protein n=1 Tax=Segatella salivae TaxID=228604 RepID=UPI001CAC7078|nr:hypothetical protein [Segatella salivae]MBF1543692.1 hypothetical protein [Segatella salivae]
MTTLILKSEYDNKPIELELTLPLSDLTDDLLDYVADNAGDNELDTDEVLSFLVNNDKLVELDYHIHDEPAFTYLKNVNLNQYNWLSVLKYLNKIEQRLDDMYDPVIEMLTDLEKHDDVFTYLKEFIVNAHNKKYYSDTFVNPQTIMDNWFDKVYKQEFLNLPSKSN